MFYRVAFMFLCALLISANANAGIYISEFLADVSTTQGDANQDGMISSSQDEFVELFNFSSDAVDISGWALHDSLALRHTFSLSTIIQPYERFVVFGGGVPTITTPFQIASTGLLSLNNGGDTISLFNSHKQLIDQVVYGTEGSQDQSLYRDLQGEDFALHATSELGGLFSPGMPLSQASHAVPEPISGVLFPLGFAVARFMKRR